VEFFDEIKESRMKIKNINGTVDNTCKCGTWLYHWKNFSDRSIPIYYPVFGCNNKPEVGAHVQKDDSIDSGWYIVPLCKVHNGQTGMSLNISDSIILVSANVSATCGKK